LDDIEKPRHEKYLFVEALGKLEDHLVVLLVRRAREIVQLRRKRVQRLV
jgi:hypothetical protein